MSAAPVVGPTVADGDEVVLHPLRWWHLDAAHVLERELFADAWSLEQFWSELAGVPATRWYVAASTTTPPAPRTTHWGAPNAHRAHSRHPVVESSLVGYAGIFVAGTNADVQTVAVAPAAQGNGLGARLLDALLTEAADRGCTRVTLEVRSDNEPAQALYRRHGFERIGVRRGYYPPDGADADVLQLRLPREQVRR